MASSAKLFNETSDVSLEVIVTGSQMKRTITLNFSGLKIVENISDDMSTHLNKQVYNRGVVVLDT